jgi:hypothetical protein
MLRLCLLPNATLLLVNCVLAAQFRISVPRELQAAMFIIVYNFTNPNQVQLNTYISLGSMHIANVS